VIHGITEGTGAAVIIAINAGFCAVPHTVRARIARGAFAAAVGVLLNARIKEAIQAMINRLAGGTRIAVVAAVDVVLAKARRSVSALLGTGARGARAAAVHSNFVEQAACAEEVLHLVRALLGLLSAAGAVLAINVIAIHSMLAFVLDTVSAMVFAAVGATSATAVDTGLTAILDAIPAMIGSAAEWAILASGGIAIDAVFVLGVANAEEVADAITAVIHVRAPRAIIATAIDASLAEGIVLSAVPAMVDEVAIPAYETAAVDPSLIGILHAI
jgi:hypothetical protein